jgi:hypothetical protein
VIPTAEIPVLNPQMVVAVLWHLVNLLSLAFTMTSSHRLLPTASRLTPALMMDASPQVQLTMIQLYCLPSDNIKQALANFHLILHNDANCFKGSLMFEVTIIAKASMPPGVSKTLKVLETSVE